MDNSTQEPISRFEQRIKDAISGSKCERIVENLISSTYSDIQRHRSKSARNTYLYILFLFLFYTCPESGILVKLPWIQFDNLYLYKEYLAVLSAAFLSLAVKDGTDQRVSETLYVFMLKYCDNSLHKNEIPNVQLMYYSDPTASVLHNEKIWSFVEKASMSFARFLWPIYAMALLLAILIVIIQVVFGCDIDLTRRILSVPLTLFSVFFFALMFVFRERYKKYIAGEADIKSTSL